MNRELKEWEKDVVTDEEINDLADFYENLTIAQLIFMKDAYQMNLQVQAQENGHLYVH